MNLEIISFIEGMSIEIISFIAGVILVFIALIGGGLKIKEIEVPKVKPIFRILCAIVGLLLLLIGIGLSDFDTEEPTNNNSVATTIEEENTTNVQDQKVYCVDCRVWNFYWVSYGVQHEALLVFNPTSGYGKMRVKYIYESKSRIIQEEMNQVSDEYGQYLAGKNPFDTFTGQPLSSYLPDNVIMEDDLVYVFDDNYTYETQLVEITDVDAILRAFNFSNTDLDF